MKLNELQAGFSLLEFTISVVIIVLTILVVFPAVEKTIETAHEHSLRATGEVFQKSVAIAHQAYIVSNQQGQVINLPRFHDGNVDFNGAGFPIGEQLSDLGDAPGDDLACVDVWNAVLGPLRPLATTDDSGQYRARYQFVEKTGRCHFEYIAGGKMSITYEYHRGKVFYDDSY